LILKLTDSDMGIVMENDQNLFRQYAAECRRLAEHASEKDRAVLLEIADAWLSCAGQEERKKGAAKQE
jgi:hypothetical protein